MLYVLTHYDPENQIDLNWATSNPDGLVLYDRSNTGIPRAIPRDNYGDADYDKLSYLVDNYDNLPDVFLWSKSNLHKFITPEEWDEVKNNTDFTPLLTKNHKTYSDARGEVCKYEGGIYKERNDSWFLNTVPARYVSTWNEWADIFNLPKPDYIPFAPGGSYLLTRERVHRYAVDFYDKMRSFLPYCQRPGEAHCAERSYYLLWS